jgi:hypothetical protein
MKKLSMLCTIVLLFGAGSAFAQSPTYQFAEAGTKNFITAPTISVGDPISLDLYLSNVPAAQNAGGAWIDFSGSTGNISYVSGGRCLADGSEGCTGPWQSNAGVFINEAGGPGTVYYVVANLAGAVPDAGDLLVGTLTLQCSAAGVATVNLTTIPSVATWSPIDDATVVPGQLVIEQVQTCTQDSECDDGLFCTGVETCDLGTNLCVPGTPPSCGDGIGCTVDICDAGLDACVNTPDDGLCDDGEFCTGVETCDVDLDCQAGDDPCPDDGLFCTGTEGCNETLDQCDPPIDPCTPPEVCIEETDECIIPPCEVMIVPPSTTVFTFEEFQFATTTDGTCGTPCYTWEISNQESTGSMVVGAGTNNATGVYTGGSGPGTDTITVTDECNGNITADAEVTVEEQPCTSDEECDDGEFCNGAETCDIGGTDLCQGGTPVDCDDGVACTEDSCDETGDTCVNEPNDANCPDDGEYCNGTEFCDADLDCSSTGDPCTGETVCDEGSDACVG